MTGCPHGRGERFSSNPNLERFLDGKIIGLILESAVAHSADNFFRADAVRFHFQYANVTIDAVEICHLYISPGHNFVGHHGREPDRYPAIEVQQIECIAGRGIRGDRYFDFKDNYKGQITFLSSEVFNELCQTLRVYGCSPSLMRRNAITRGVDLNELIGRDFEVQGVHFHGTQECKPCYWMDRAIAPGAEKFLRGRGGLRARILTDGVLRSTALIEEAVNEA
jgi:hypothetical protein